MDDVLIGLGDAYEADANLVRAQPVCGKQAQGPCLPEAAKSRLEQEYDGKAAAYYRDVVLHHAAAPHAEDAKERLQAMNLPLPTPTAEEVAASDALEGSRAQYTMRKRLELLFVRKPDTVMAAQVGAPPLGRCEANSCALDRESVAGRLQGGVGSGSCEGGRRRHPTHAGLGRLRV